MTRLSEQSPGGITLGLAAQQAENGPASSSHAEDSSQGAPSTSTSAPETSLRVGQVRVLALRQCCRVRALASRSKKQLQPEWTYLSVPTRAAPLQALDKYRTGVLDLQVLLQSLLDAVEKEREELQQERAQLTEERKAFAEESSRVQRLLNDSEQVTCQAPYTLLACQQGCRAGEPTPGSGYTAGYVTHRQGASIDAGADIDWGVVLSVCRSS